MGRPKGCKDSRPRMSKARRLDLAARGASESSRILSRRLGVAAAGGGLSVGEQRTLTPHSLAEFEREQIARIKRITDRSVNRVRFARGEMQRERERATRHEVVLSYDVEVRGSCGSDVHAGGGES